jgi:hypothetical protein
MGAQVAVGGGLGRAQARLIEAQARLIEAVRGYSPITLQMKPIEMKKPEKSAIRPSPP